MDDCLLSGSIGLRQELLPKWMSWRCLLLVTAVSQRGTRYLNDLNNFPDIEGLGLQA